MKFSKDALENSKLMSFLTKLAFPILGLASFIWFLVRVIPKPSRATYPCMRVAFPMASSFITWIIGTIATITAFKVAKQRLQKAQYFIAAAFILIGLGAGIFVVVQLEMPAVADIIYNYEHPSNQPIGEAQGIFPGRVAWAFDPDATNENQTGTDDGEMMISENDDYYFLKKNNDQTVIDGMLDDVLLSLTGETTIASAWDALFKYHNNKKTGNETGYTPGEKIFIKINATSIIQGDGGQPWHTWEPTELTKMKPGWWDHPDVVETTPQIVLSVLRHLVNEAGVQQGDIYIGDPLKNVYKHLFDYWKNEFPDINVLGNNRLYNGMDFGAMDRIPVEPTATDVVFYSDKGANMDEAVSDKLYTIHEQASYMINIPVLKAHACAGITLCAKNHFGSHARESAQHLHKGLVGVENDNPFRTDYGMYRVQVDLMGHELLGGNTMLFLIDGLYSGREGWTDAYPVKWQMAPFNGDFTNSIIASQDPVAIEAVCFDLLRTEYNGPEVENNRPNMAGVDDYLKQAADPSKWPDNIVYDPENDGTPITSLGVYENWNNPVDMQYSRNLGTGDGIELVKIFNTSTAVEKIQPMQKVGSFQLKPNYPNPFNPTTTISYELERPSKVELAIYNIRGELVNSLVNSFQSAGSYALQWDGTASNGLAVPSGMYIYQLHAIGAKTNFIQSRKMILQK